MSARRCSDCGITYPSANMTCLVCEGDCSYFTNMEPDEDWVEKVAEKRRFLDPDDNRPLIPEVTVPVKVRDDQLWIDAWDLWHTPERLFRLQPGALLKVGQQFFEVQGYQGATHSYWVRSFDPSAEGIEEQIAQWERGE